MSDTQPAKNDTELIEMARRAKSMAFCPHSEFAVGAALRTDQGIYLGANVEISGRSTSVHAEMMAAYVAVLDGATSFDLLAVSPENQTGEAPCGLCQHTLAQFTEKLRIVEDTGDVKPRKYYALSELLEGQYTPSTRHAEYLPEHAGDDTITLSGGLFTPLRAENAVVEVEIPALVAPDGRLYAVADYDADGKYQTEGFMLKDAMHAKLEDTEYDLADCQKVTVEAEIDMIDLFMDYATEGKVS